MYSYIRNFKQINIVNIVYTCTRMIIGIIIYHIKSLTLRSTYVIHTAKS